MCNFQLCFGSYVQNNLEFAKAVVGCLIFRVKFYVVSSLKSYVALNWLCLKEESIFKIHYHHKTFLVYWWCCNISYSHYELELPTIVEVNMGLSPFVCDFVFGHITILSNFHQPYVLWMFVVSPRVQRHTFKIRAIDLKVKIFPKIDANMNMLNLSMWCVPLYNICMRVVLKDHHPTSQFIACYKIIYKRLDCTFCIFHNGTPWTMFIMW
jgi:hypothetical protein